ncbi:unnamed protein product [Mesocestoides corti]|uniref:Uncharacterized protein n=1 Tax=Mesocestoides corti TaxID=53468 RepID=A0A0R3UD08_MESCO|nr:unnamed protein product [Mesocestoides corti]
MRPDLLNQVENLERDLNRLDDRIRREGQRELDEFSRRLEASGNRDSTLTEQARNATETIRNIRFVHFSLKEEAAEVRGTVQDIDTILRSLEFDAEALAQSTRRAFDKLNSQLKRLKDVMATQKEALKSEIDHVQRLTMDQRQRLAKLNEAIENAPDVGAEQSKLEGILRDWNDALSRGAGPTIIVSNLDDFPKHDGSACSRTPVSQIQPKLSVV